MASQSQGIQQLLIAEKRAAEKVLDARKRKQQRLKQAKIEAQEEIDKFMKSREGQFQKFESNFMGSQEGEAGKIEVETALKIENTSRLANCNKNFVVQDILQLVYDIKPKVHKNYFKQISL